MPLLGGWKLASSLKTSMSDVISFVFFFLSGSFIRSDRKTSIIKRWWAGVVGAGGGGADDPGCCVHLIESRLRGLKIGQKQRFNTSGLLFSTRFLLFKVQVVISGFCPGWMHFTCGFVSTAVLPADGGQLSVLTGQVAAPGTRRPPAGQDVQCQKLLPVTS